MIEQAIKPKLDCWGVVEIMGHTRLAGHLLEEERLGSVMLRVDVPKPDGEINFTRWFSGGAIFSISPTTREMAIAMAQVGADGPPVKAYELEWGREAVAKAAAGGDEHHHDDDCLM